VQDAIFTDRLELRPGSVDAYATAPEDRERLAEVLGALVPDAWPVENYDEEALQYSLRSLAAGEEPPMSYMIERATNTLVGVVGGGSPKDGTLLTGYAVLPQYQRRGYATEAVAGLIAWAFGRADVDRIIADTYPELVASIRVLEKNGFRHIGAGDGERVIRYERSR
jgi:[ribosomal protein S5]-alanine N-acetyltransferase